MKDGYSGWWLTVTLVCTGPECPTKPNDTEAWWQEQIVFFLGRLDIQFVVCRRMSEQTHGDYGVCEALGTASSVSPWSRVVISVAARRHSQVALRLGRRPPRQDVGQCQREAVAKPSCAPRTRQLPKFWDSRRFPVIGEFRCVRRWSLMHSGDNRDP